MFSSLLFLQSSGWGPFLGRLHPLLVHLPIGFLLLAVLLEIGQRTGRLSVSESVKSFVLLCSAIGATFSCGAGLFLAANGGYDEAMVSTHQWQGIGVALCLWVAWLVTLPWVNDRVSFLSVLYYPAFGLGVLLLLAAGHMGGSLTHGEDYLTQYTPEPFRTLAGMEPLEADPAGKEIKPLENVDEALVYEEIVQPILTARCVQCHGGSKQKGKLRLDSFEQLSKGGENGAVFTAGNGQTSGLVQVCLLPLNDDFHMPPKGKTQLTSSQIALIGWWIDQGAPLKERVASLNQPDSMKPHLQTLAAGASGGAIAASGISTLEVPPGDEQAISELRKHQVIVSPVSREQNLLEISAVNAPAFSDEQVTLLKKLSDQVVWLKLGHTGLTDKGAIEIAGLKNLYKLYLEHTQVSDAILPRLQELTKLEYLNLMGTQVSDAGIPELAKLTSLKKVFLWQSAVTDSGLAALRRLRPDLEAPGGLDAEVVNAFLEAANKKDSLDPKTKAAAK